jgi:3-hydroxyacyl-CoA dehydrogenase/enoyl-CoA hydratase/3-hydroxybutyryl-CoA epimerase
MDEVGLDVLDHAAGVMTQAFGERLAPLPGIHRMVEQGRLGRKSGKGFFLYADGKKQGADPTALQVIGATAGRQFTDEEIEQRLVYPLLNEAAMALEEGVVRSARDGDIAAVFGFGFPPFRGGPLRYIDRFGAKNLVEALRRLEEKHGKRFTPTESLMRMAAAGTTYYPAA